MRTKNMNSATPSTIFGITIGDSMNALMRFGIGRR